MVGLVPGISLCELFIDELLQMSFLELSKNQFLYTVFCSPRSLQRWKWKKEILSVLYVYFEGKQIADLFITLTFPLFFNFTHSTHTAVLYIGKSTNSKTVLLHNSGSWNGCTPKRNLNLISSPFNVKPILFRKWQENITFYRKAVVKQDLCMAH